jgi:hypothetical protein
LTPGCFDWYDTYVSVDVVKWWGNTAGASLHEQLQSTQKDNLSKSGVRLKRSVEQSTDPIEPHIEGQLKSKKGAKEKGDYFGNNSGCM